MIPESQQEQASLYALGLLGADEAAAFEQEISTDADLRAFVRDLQETIALLAWAGDQTVQEPPLKLRERILAEAATIQIRSVANTLSPRASWIPWAIAALLLGCSGTLLWGIQNRQARLTDVEKQLAQAKISDANHSLAQVSFCALESTPDFKTSQPRAMVLWDAAHRQGKLRVNRLAPPAEGKDYQLWTVEKNRKDPVSAGVFHVGADGTADVSFQTVSSDDKEVAAVAISLEEAGGSPTNRGPILLLGKF